MGIENPEVLYTNGCRVIVNNEFCGRPADAPIHGSFGDHEYQD